MKARARRLEIDLMKTEMYMFVTQERDESMKQRTPMQWSSSRLGGFTAANNAWMSPADDFHTRNVQVGHLRLLSLSTVIEFPDFVLTPVQCDV